MAKAMYVHYTFILFSKWISDLFNDISIVYCFQIFVHHDDCSCSINPQTNQRYRNIKLGSKVEFVIKKNDESSRDRAVEVTAIGGGECEGGLQCFGNTEYCK